MTKSTGRLQSDGRLRDLGIVDWVIARTAAKAVRAEHMHLFNVLGQHRRLFWAWLPFSGVLLGLGKLPRRDTELVILRVGHLRDCTYELQHHSRIAKRYGLDEELQARIAAGPDPNPRRLKREDILMCAVDEIVTARMLSPRNYEWLAEFYNEKQVIEFVMLATQYDALAATISVLEIPLDFSEN